MATVDDKTPDARDASWAFAAICIALSPHVTRFSFWMLLVFAAMGTWRVLGGYRMLPLPDRKHLGLWLLKQILAVAAFVAIYAHYNGQLGRDAGVVLLTTLLGLKMLEMHSSRDYYIVMFLGYFMIVTNLLYSQTLLTALYMVGAVLFITAGLVNYNVDRKHCDERQCFRLAARYVVHALPLMVVLFFLFPRFPGPLWGVPQDSFDGVTGLDDEMTIGNIARLGISDEIAFQVEFDGPAPAARNRYWRGPILWETDGRTWRSGDAGAGRAAAGEALGPTFHYSVILEPHSEKWGFGLETVTATDEQFLLTRDYRLLAKRKLRRRIRYDLSSVVEYRNTNISAREREAALQLPTGAHPRTRELAARWHSETGGDDAFIDRILRHFNEQPYLYTLVPKPLDGDPIDSFLFDTREGFCEYYASTFVVLLRSAGIPARVVTGYQGGEYNSVSDFMVIRQRDAHAWAEAYLDGRGWTRFDPTAAVAPERVALGIGDALPRREALTALGRDHPLGIAWRRVSDLVGALNYNWSRWILGYTPKQQQRLLENIGITKSQRSILMITLTAAGAVLMIVIAWLTLREVKGARDPVQQIYQRLCRKLARAGFERAANEGPLEFVERVALARADLKDELLDLIKLYTAIRYAEADIPAAQFAAAVKRFKLGEPAAA